MSLINCKAEPSLAWGEKCVLSGGEDIADGVIVANAGTAATFKITDVKLYVLVVTLLAEDNLKLSKQLNDGFERSVYWNKYRMDPNKKEEPPNNVTSSIRELLDSNYQGVKRLFVLAYDDTNTNTGVKVDSYQKYFLPRVNIENYNTEIYGRNFYDQPINNPVKKI